MLKYPNDLNETQSDSITFAHSPYRPNKGGDFFGGSTASVPANVSEMIRLYVPNSTPALSQTNDWNRGDFEGAYGVARLNAVRAITNGINNIGGEGDFAGALKDHKRAIILGENSYGKGSVQSIIPLRNGGGMRLTISKYYLPSGKSISEVGVTPDILVEEKGKDFKINSEKDNQLNYVIKLFNS